jgi:hypothetical protein
MLSEIRAQTIQEPIAFVARRLLALDVDVQAVMVVGDDGRVLAHERALDDDEFDSFEEEGHPLLFYASGPRLLFYLRVSRQSTVEDISDRVIATISSPTFTMTR